MKREEYQRNYELEESYWWFTGMRKVYFALLDLIFHDTTDISVLDVGCGTGAMLRYLRRYGTVTGFDVSEIALKLCRHQSRLVQGSADSLPFAAESFDLITALGLIEHVEDDAKVVEELYRVCKPGGYVLSFTSAFMFLWSHHDEANRHFRRYTAGEFRNLFESVRFEVVKISYINTFLFPPILLARLIQRWTGIDKRIHERDFIKMPALLNSSLSGLLGIEASLIKRVNLPFGVGLICVSRKS